MSCHDVRPLLPARAEELTPPEARMRADHVAGCQRCAVEASAYGRLGQALALMGALEAEPPGELLERVLAGLERRRVSGSRVAVVAAGSATALLAGVVVARALRQRRRPGKDRAGPRTDRAPAGLPQGKPLVAAVPAQ
jgi:hypothetical protein